MLFDLKTMNETAGTIEEVNLSPNSPPHKPPAPTRAVKKKHNAQRDVTANFE